MDGVITALIFRHDYLGNSPYKNSAAIAYISLNLKCTNLMKLLLWSIYSRQLKLKEGKVYPPISALQDVSAFITKRGLALTIKEKTAMDPELKKRGDDLDTFIQENLWQAEYLPYKFKSVSINQTK